VFVDGSEYGDELVVAHIISAFSIQPSHRRESVAVVKKVQRELGKAATSHS